MVTLFACRAGGRTSRRNHNVASLLSHRDSKIILYFRRLSGDFFFQNLHSIGIGGKSETFSRLATQYALLVNNAKNICTGIYYFSLQKQIKISKNYLKNDYLNNFAFFFYRKIQSQKAQNLISSQNWKYKHFSTRTNFQLFIFKLLWVPESKHTDRIKKILKMISLHVPDIFYIQSKKKNNNNKKFVRIQYQARFLPE